MKQLADSLQATYICPDDIRKKVTGDAADQSQNEAVWQQAQDMMTTALSNCETVVMDATFTKEHVRKHYIDVANTHNAESIEVYVFPIDIDDALKRNASRERVVPEEVIKNMYSELWSHPPTQAEGINVIHVVQT
jgi:predicted kinase